MRHRNSTKLQQLFEKHKKAEDLDKVIHNPVTLGRLLDELVDYFYQLHFLAVIVNLFNVINACAGFEVNIKRNSSETTSLQLKSGSAASTEATDASHLPNETRNICGKIVDSNEGLHSNKSKNKQLQREHTESLEMIARSNAELDDLHEKRNDLQQTLQLVVKSLDVAVEATRKQEDPLEGVSATVVTPETWIVADLEAMQNLEQKIKSDTVLNLDLLQEAEDIDRYTTDLIQELRPTVGSAFRKS